MNYSKNAVLILDIKGNVNSSQKYARIRHAKYGEELFSKYGSALNLVVISIANFCRQESIAHTDFIQLRRSFLGKLGFIFQCLGILKTNNINVSVLVCSDPWESFLAARILKILLNQNFKIQVQVHADISDNQWKFLSIKNLVRSYLQRYTLRKADQIRTVSPIIGNFLESELGIKRSAIEVVPIPIEIERNISKLMESRRRDITTIGLFGRVHWDRGIQDFIRAIEILNSEQCDLFIEIAGKGPQERYLQSRLTEIVGSQRLEFLGFLEKRELEKAILGLDIYFSMAAVESFGLGIREAITLGVPVIAKESNGSKLAQAEYGEECIHILPIEFDKKDLLDAFLWASGVERGNFSIEKTNLKSKSQIVKLVDTWWKLAHS